MVEIASVSRFEKIWVSLGLSLFESALQGGTHYEAAMRRAALMNTDDEESDGEAESEDASSDSEPEEDLQAKIDACSDDEAKEELREAQLRKMMEDSQARLAAHCFPFSTVTCSGLHPPAMSPQTIFRSHEVKASS